MAQKTTLLFSKDFVSSAFIEVTHSLNQHSIGIQCIVNETSLPAGRFLAVPSTDDPNNIFTLEMPVTSSGRIQVFSVDMTFPGLPTNDQLNQFQALTTNSVPSLSTSLDAHKTNTNNPHGTSISNIVQGSLAQLNSNITDATLDDSSASRTPSGAASGDLGGTFPSPVVSAFTSGSTQIVFDNIPDGLLLQRSGNSVIGVTASVVPGDADFFSAYDSAGGTTFTSTTFIDIPLGAEHKKTSIFSHTNGQATITIGNTGTYVIGGYITINQTSGNTRTECQGRLVKNSGAGFVEVPGTRLINYSRSIAEGGNTASFTITLDLVAGDVIKLQGNRSKGGGTCETLLNGSGINIHSVVGKKGDQGEPGVGGGTIQIKNSGTIITGSASAINFGNNLSVTNNGSGQVTVDGIFGSEFSTANSLAVSTTTNTAYQTKVILGPVTLTGGTYRIDTTYGWNNANQYYAFFSNLQEDAGAGYVTINQEQESQPSGRWGTFGSTGNGQKYFTSRFVIRTLSAGTYSWRIQWKTEDVDYNASIWDTYISIYRVS